MSDSVIVRRTILVTRPTDDAAVMSGFTRVGRFTVAALQDPEACVVPRVEVVVVTAVPRVPVQGLVDEVNAFIEVDSPRLLGSERGSRAMVRGCRRK
jgi:hypothetical protein